MLVVALSPSKQEGTASSELGPLFNMSCDYASLRVGKSILGVTASVHRMLSLKIEVIIMFVIRFAGHGCVVQQPNGMVPRQSHARGW